MKLLKNKLLINVSLPAAELSFDLYIPNNKKIGTIKQKIVNSILSITNNSINISAETVKIIDKDSGIEYGNDMCIKDSGIKNGSKLVLV